MAKKHLPIPLAASAIIALFFACTGLDYESPSSTKAIKAFSFLSPAATGMINEADFTVAVSIPYGTDVTALVPVINHTGAGIDPEWGIPQDFTAPVTYTVKAEDASMQAYTVTVTLAAAGPFKVSYSVGAYNTSGTVPVDGNDYALNASVTVLDNTDTLAGPEIQDGIRQRFAGWNTRADGYGTAYAAGDAFPITGNMALHAMYTTTISVMRKVGPSGGWVFYDAGSVQGWGRYLEAANADLANSAWGTAGFAVTGADGTAIGTGKQNTADIVDIAAGDPLPNKAADRCSSYSVVYDSVTYDDWFLPSRDELYTLYDNLKAFNVGGFASISYWSSYESNNNLAMALFFDGRITVMTGKDLTDRCVRAVRAF